MQIDQALENKAVQTIQMLAVDAVEKANSGHPGAPMGLASIAFEIWMRHLRFDPADPAWPDRDRFVLSAGHASMLLYSLLHLSGILSLDELKQFRQLGSRTPGHPEVGITPGVEVTTGPLGAGISTAVGIAAALKMNAARAGGRTGVASARVFGIASDGDIMEGISHEASSLAGHLGLDNLVFFYDDNRITIDGKTDLAMSEDVPRRYEAYGWFVQTIDGHDHDAIRNALDRAVAESSRPSIIVARTIIANGSPNKANSSKAHGEPLGAKEVEATKRAIGWPIEPTFHVPDDVRALFAARAEEGRRARAAWQNAVAKFEREDAEAARAYRQLLECAVPANLFTELCAAAPRKDAATRVHAGVIEQRAAALVPSLVGGSADLNPSTKTYIEGSGPVVKGKFDGRNIHFGVREHAMGAFVNGLALSGAYIPFGSTFLVFSDYMRPAIRLAALSHLRSIFVFTHDSVFLGEDGPTHQPIEHLWALRMIPNVDVVRPADSLECAAAWTHAMTRRNGPTVLALSRQKVPELARAEGFDNDVMLRGGYILADAKGGAPSVILIATGSEVGLAVDAKKLLEKDGERVRVVSMPCLEQFRRQDQAYREHVLPMGIPRVAIEVGVTAPWYSVVGDRGLVIGRDDFGASAPDKDLAKAFGFVPEVVAAKVRSMRR
ncbi:MAG: transketolase [Polyangiaceae bacterium]|nr:transketolase [Polyangiaceae bacterium]